ncbi:MAG TPA: RHS repeat protein, partial [Gammaproteobacteria bacterium]|nr:RHS repeat protein [Gammaproteobacteria bacterium]
MDSCTFKSEILAMHKSHFLKCALYGLVFLLGSQPAPGHEYSGVKHQIAPAVKYFMFGDSTANSQPTLGMLFAWKNKIFEDNFNRCMESVAGSSRTDWYCHKWTILNQSGPHAMNDNSFTNGEPHYYGLDVEKMTVWGWQPTTITFLPKYFAASPLFSCRPPYKWHYDGPVEAGTYRCELFDDDTIKDLGKPQVCNPTNPINIATGNKYQKELDFKSGSTGLRDFIRHYNSTESYNLISIGKNWNHSYSLYVDHFAGIDGQATESLSFNRPDGRIFVFSKSSGAWVGDSDVTDSVKDHVDGSGALDGWDYVTASNSIEHYDLSGRLLSITSPDGRAQALSYDANDRLASVTGAYGHSLTFVYDAAGRIATVTDPNSGVYTYSYDANDNLVSVEYPDATTRQYLYEDVNFPNALTGIIDENGDRFASWTYDLQGRAISSEHAGGHDRYDVTYSAAGTSTLTDAAGNITTYSFKQLYGVYKTTSVQGDICSSCGEQDAAKTYDANGFLASRTDQNGNVTTYVNDARGLELSRTEAAGTPQARTIATEWHPDYRLPVKVTRPSVASGKSAITETSYNDVAHPGLPTVITRSGFAPDGRALAVRTISLKYTADGRVAQIDGPRSDVADITAMTYYANDATEGTNRGQLKTVSNALGHTVTYDSYDAYGNVLQMTDANGTVTAYTYDSRQRVLSQTVTPAQGAPRTTTYSYDGVGRLISATTPVGVTLTYTYDAAKNLLSISDNLGNRIEYAYDLKGNRIQEMSTDPDGILVRLVDTTYNSHDRVDSINAAGSLTSMVYDAVGNLISTTDPNYNNPTTHSYDALNRLMQSVDAISGTTSYDYDVNDRIISMTAPNNARTTYAYDDLGNLLVEQSPDRGARTYVYDA